MTVRASVEGATISMRGQLQRGLYLSYYGRKKIMRWRDCVRSLDTPLVCARRHHQMTMKGACLRSEL